MQDNAERAGDIFKAEWLARFISRFSERMRASGYDGEPDLADISKQHADAAWDCRDADDEPEAAADAEFEALADSL
ncbi:hypothetical protein LPB73_07700 [Tardiphaga sp. 37S4]|uniref:hypothetical protein n=1 Tax=Tardiphaga sp. 37S4 TaxID=1404741 RepID=UPI001E5F9CFF|nr:hypothetical protein [Tardiphaga sp. 37S4]UFS77252.1 hypothetical protein LPB73_07700 [Tardiphaga sp. 37S4]